MVSKVLGYIGFARDFMVFIGVSRFYTVSRVLGYLWFAWIFMASRVF